MLAAVPDASSLKGLHSSRFEENALTLLDEQDRLAGLATSTVSSVCSMNDLSVIDSEGDLDQRAAD